MKEKKRSLFNWKRIIGLLVVVVLVLILVFITLLYRHIESTRTAHFTENEEFLKEAAQLMVIDQMYHFQGEKGYFIAYGQDDQSKEWLVFNPEKNQDPEKVLIFPSDELATQAEVEKLWQSTCDRCQLKGSSPAMINQRPLWEITYLDANKRYVIEYISLQESQVYEKLKLHLKYNMKG